MPQPNGTGTGSGSVYVAGLDDDMDGERRPLLAARPHRTSSTLRPEPGFWRHLLINTQSSPGTDDPNPLVRWPARTWNVTKVTLFSCMYSLC